MLTSMSPVGENARGQRWWLTTTSYAVASTVGGAVLGLALGGLGRLTVDGLDPGTRLLILAATLLGGLLLDRAGRLPSWRRQVDERWLTRYRGWVYGAGFGAQLGVGVVTIVSSSVTYAAFLAALLAATPSVGAATGATFGLVRALPLLGTKRVTTAPTLHARFSRFELGERLADRWTRGFQAACVAGAVAGAIAGAVRL